MRKRQKENILVSFFKEKDKYKKIAEYVVRFIEDDPSAPKENLHTILYRIKNEKRLIEKIDEENKELDSTKSSITLKNYQKRVDDLLGIRLICLRLSDIKKIEVYLSLLEEEKIFRFIGTPNRKISFILPVDPDETIPEDLDLRYSGYSSIHYQVELGENSDTVEELKGLPFELQLRTILEEAWGEIDHKYRYVYTRRGDKIPEHIHTGFYNLSAYLQAAALQAEHICRQSDAYRLSKIHKTKGKFKARVIEAESNTKDIYVDNPTSSTLLSIFQAELKEIFGFKLTFRTLIYILKRLDSFNNREQPQVVFRKFFTKERLKDFKSIFYEINMREPFEDISKRNIDAINAVNYALSDEKIGNKIAREGLKSVLRWRKNNVVC